LGKNWEKVGKSGKKWEKVGKSGKKWEKVGKSGKKWEKVGKLGKLGKFQKKSVRSQNKIQMQEDLNEN
jgi:hypothetical protein